MTNNLNDYYSLVEKHKIKTLIVVNNKKEFQGIINKYNIDTFKALAGGKEQETVKVMDIMSDKNFTNPFKKKI